MTSRDVFVDSARRRPRTFFRLAIGFVVMMTTMGVLATAVDAIEIPFVESFLWQLLAAPTLIVLARLLARKIDRRDFRQYGLTWQPARFLVGGLLGIALVAVVFGVQQGLGWTIVLDRMHNQYNVAFAAGWIGFALRYAAVAVFEELFHRGFLITNLAEGIGGFRRRDMLACVCAALLFGALHLTNEDATLLAAVNVALLGLLLGFAYLRTRSLSFSIGLHFAWNFGLGNVFGLPVSGYEPRVCLILTGTRGPAIWTGGEFGPEGGLLLTLILAATLAVFGALRIHPHD